MIYIDKNLSTDVISKLLSQLSWIDGNETIKSLETAGEGNMNVVLRINTSSRSFILKQSRPHVQKYPQIDAPLERIITEKIFYQSLDNKDINAFFPRFIHFSKTHFLLMIEDLGNCPDMTLAYNQRSIEKRVIEKLILILSRIHAIEPPEDFPENMALRLLNHAHIFVLPFEKSNGFNLDDVQSGLQELSLPFKNDSLLKSIVKKVGVQYLSPGNKLLHGDYYPGSWLYNEKSIYIIDPEFSFVGFAEYDLGVMAAHLFMITHDDSVLPNIAALYPYPIDRAIYSKMVGIEIARRMIGLAQLPINRTLEEKKYLLDFAYKLIIG